MIYFCTEEGVERGPVKIGLTRVIAKGKDWRHSIAYRLSAHQISTPRILVVTSAMEGADTEERELHLRFGNAWVIGEWFSRTPELDALMNEHRIEPIYCLGFDGRFEPVTTPAPVDHRIPDLVSAETIEQWIGFEPGFMRKLRRSGHGPPFIRATKSLYVYRREDVDAWIVSIRVNPSAPKRKEQPT